MSKYLFTILTSSKLNFLIESYNSVLNQVGTKIDYDIVIIINSLNENYYNTVLNYFSQFGNFTKGVKIVKTESNGSPGKGHNSCLEYFKNNSKYSHLFQIDGDDFIYPWFLKSMENYLQYPYNPDILLLPFSDIIDLNYNSNKIHYPFEKCFYYYNLESLECMNRVYEVKKSPFKHKLENINTPARILFISRQALNKINFKYQENVKLYDDLYPFLQIMEYNKLFNDLNIYFVEDYYLHINNRLNEDSLSDNFLKNKEENYLLENKNFQDAISNKFLSIRNFNLKEIKVLSNTTKKLLKKKYEFAKQLLNNLDLNKNNNFIVNKEEIIKFHKFLIDNNYESIYSK